MCGLGTRPTDRARIRRISLLPLTPPTAGSRARLREDVEGVQGAGSSVGKNAWLPRLARKGT